MLSYQMLWPSVVGLVQRVSVCLPSSSGSFLLLRLRSPRLFDLQRRDLRHPARVAPALESRVQPGVDDRERRRPPGRARAHAQHVGVVVRARQPRRLHVPDVDRAHAVDLVGGDADAQPGAAHQHAQRAGVVAHGAADRGRPVRVVGRLSGRRPEILDLEAERAQVRDHPAAQLEARVIAAGEESFRCHR